MKVNGEVDTEQTAFSVETTKNVLFYESQVYLYINVSTKNSRQG